MYRRIGCNRALVVASDLELFWESGKENSFMSQLSRILVVLAVIVIAFAASTTVYAVGDSYFTTNRMNWTVGNQYYGPGQVGFGFIAAAGNDIVVDGLGRGVPPGHPLTGSHTIRIWDTATQTIIAQAVVDGSSPVTAGGFAYATLSTPVTLIHNAHYRITSTEYASSSGIDLWGDYTSLGSNHSSWGTINGYCYVWVNQGQPGGFMGAYPDTLTGNTEEAYSQPTFFGAAQAPQNGTLSGIVTNSLGAPIANATVKESLNRISATTGADGHYSLSFVPGTYTFTASNAASGFDPLTVNGITISSSTTTTQNFQLPNGATISGTVTDNSSLHTPMAGVSVATTDGQYITTTGTAGTFNLNVTHGNYYVSFSKADYIKQTLRADASTSNVTLSVVLVPGWDFAAEFATSQSGAWSYGYYGGSVANLYTQAAFQGMTQYISNAAPTSQLAWVPLWWQSVGTPPSFTKSLMSTPVENDPGYGTAYRESQKVIATGGVNAGGENAPTGNLCVARFTAPKSGYYTMTVRWAGAVPTGTFSKVGLLANGSWAFGGPGNEKIISGFAGRSANNYSDSGGSSPVQTYSVTRLVSADEQVDAVVYGTAPASGWTQLDFSVSPPTNVGTLQGHVTANLPGNPPVVNATVEADGNLGSTYTAQTDSAGYYSMVLEADTYDLVANGYSYGNTSIGSVPVGIGAVVQQDFSVTLNGYWSFMDEYSGSVNPANQWSYGRASLASDGRTFSGFSRYSMITAGNHGAGLPWMVWKNAPSDNQWTGTIGVNTTNSPCEFVIFPDVNHPDWGRKHIPAGWNAISTGDNSSNTTVRWTAPDSRVIKINADWKSETFMSDVYGPYPCNVVVARNGQVIGGRSLQGFYGRASSGFTDSIGPAREVSLQVTVPVSSGDTIDFSHTTSNNWVWYALDAKITTSAGTTVTNIAGLKNALANPSIADGSAIFLMTPVQLGSSMASDYSIDKRFGGLTTVTHEQYFYVQGDDRVGGVKCIADGDLPTYDRTFKVALSGVKGTDYLGQKVLVVQSILSATAGTTATPLGKTSKGATNSSSLVRVWGKITQLVANTNTDPSEFDGTTRKWDYEYMVINDGGQDITIPMHVQANYMSVTDPTIGSLAVGQYVAVTGIAGTTTGSNVAVYPRNQSDIVNYAGH